MAWRLADSLKTLLKEVNAIAPNRSKESDGTIGDAAHASRCSRHNPNAAGVVTALDVTSDPAGGMPIHDIADAIRRDPNRHPELSYIISNRSTAGRSTGWQWVGYSGTNPHEKHVHFGVGNGSDCSPTQPYDSTQSWHLSGQAPPVSEEDIMATAAELRAIVRSELDRGTAFGQVSGAGTIAATLSTAQDIANLVKDVKASLRTGRQQLYFVQARGDDSVFLTDFLTKREVSPKERNVIAFVTAATGAPVSSGPDNAPHVLDPDVVTSIPKA